MRMLITEAQQLMWEPPKLWEVHAEPYDMKISRWTPDKASYQFLHRFGELLRKKNL